jgi:hypothetical protein
MSGTLKGVLQNSLSTISMHSSSVQLVGILVVGFRPSVLVFVSAAFSIVVVSCVSVLDDVTTVGEAGKVVDSVPVGCSCGC